MRGGGTGKILDIKKRRKHFLKLGVRVSKSRGVNSKEIKEGSRPGIPPEQGTRSSNLQPTLNGTGMIVYLLEGGGGTSAITKYTQVETINVPFRKEHVKKR